MNVGNNIIRSTTLTKVILIYPDTYIPNTPCVIEIVNREYIGSLKYQVVIPKGQEINYETLGTFNNEEDAIEFAKMKERK